MEKTLDMSNAHMNGDRPACEAPEQSPSCPVCSQELELTEVTSMGPGYVEWENLTPHTKCSCGFSGRAI